MLDDKLGALAGTVGSPDTPPTAQSYDVFKGLSERLNQQLATWKHIHRKDLAALNEMVRKDNVPAIVVPSSKAANDGGE